MTHFLYREQAEEAVRLVAQPLLDSFVANNLTGGREAIHIVMIDPDSSGNEPRILFEMTLGEIPAGKEYVTIARQKAVQAWIHQMDTRELVRLYPHLLSDGDVTYSGGVYRHRMAIGASGLPSVLDEVIGVAGIESCRALSFVNSEAWMDIKDAPLFLPSSAPVAA